ncbi:aliphatic sulfonate ABC transporter substrate-binding protein [Evansella cellulosilytica]|uniref:Aliphatic sulfonates family ABC transporter, periplasmic ligand-binding protein n=1 Tax=Evansella cellulosilytica (strain ATCC 21833 / DSM 2522 / FERM P-1141 / JCM 9156 / N-4) TaxID=649639 RepID=E6U0C1_EVAC2|nr:aliphatic sulfonate ABC transporter substrate-binding protein [Evansella cellulosilytica]ADU30237.1 aliphatic sulfonates family ABC transporter, periplasmic ligand-binding protein [Evansella cellulosilytica DSM 2522]
MKKLRVLLFSILTLLFITACGQSDNGNSGASGDKNGDVTIGYFPNLDHAAGIIGKEKGYFAEEITDYNVDFQNFPNGNDFIDALDTGGIDLGYVGPGPAINYFLSGGDVVVIGAAANGATLIVSREDSGIYDLEDFDGKSFCTPGNGCTHNVQLEIMLNEIGLVSNRLGGTVEHQSRINPATMVGMFEQGEIDAAAAPEPWGTLLVEEHNANVVVEWNEVFLGEELASVVIVTTSEYLENNPEVVEQALRAHKRAVDYAHENTEDTLKTVNDLIFDLTQSRLPEHVLEKAWDRMAVTTETHGDALQAWATASYELQFMDVDPNLDGFVDTSILDRIVSE